MSAQLLVPQEFAVLAKQTHRYHVVLMGDLKTKRSELGKAIAQVTKQTRPLEVKAKLGALVLNPCEEVRDVYSDAVAKRAKILQDNKATIEPRAVAVRDTTKAMKALSIQIVETLGLPPVQEAFS